MGANLLPVWAEISRYLKSGISLIPVRDRDEGGMEPKTPYGSSWKKYQQEIISEKELFEMMDVKYDTTAVAIVCGKVSGNLEIIDVDVKYKPDIGAILFTSLNQLYPELLFKLRIHTTPSGGYHILYRCEEEIPGSQKLAGRNKTKEELSEKPYPKVVNFIETRGEGGYALAPPSLSYGVKNDVPIPTLTKSERASLIALCESFSEIVKVIRPPKPKKEYVKRYDVTPFEDFNDRVDPTELIESLGWKYFKHNSRYIYYTRPGKSSGVSMSFNLETRYFYCFTASTELEEGKGYAPSIIYMILGFGGDGKALYRDLVTKGYGNLKPRVEQKILRAAVINRKELPANVSQAAKVEYEQLELEITGKYPHGMFWIDSMEKGIQVDRHNFYSVAAGLGFFLHEGNIIKQDGIWIEEVDERFFFDHIKGYIQEEDADLYRDICNAYEFFIERHGKFTISRLPLLDESKILKDTANDCYKVYNNGVLHITAKGWELEPVSNFGDYLIWKSKVRQREFIEGRGGRYLDFLEKAVQFSQRRDYIKSCIGFLAHEYKDDTTGYIIVLLEECRDPKDGGGAGKNLLSKLFKETTSVSGIPGDQVKYDSTFLQSWRGEKIFTVSDAPENFKYSFLKELSTGSALVKYLYKDEIAIPEEKLPKFLIQSNYSPKTNDGGLLRRIKVVEFTDFFTKSQGIDVHYGIRFPSQWNEEDYSGYDTLIAKSVKHYLSKGKKIESFQLSDSGWTKRFEITYGKIITGFIDENIESWETLGEITNDDFFEQLNRYCTANNVQFKYKPSSFRLNAALTDYCRHKDISYAADLQKREDGVKVKYRLFGKEEVLPF